MTIRNITPTFQLLRAKHRTNRPQNELAEDSLPPPLEFPVWVQIVEKFSSHLESARRLTGELKKLHEIRLKNVFQEESQIEQDNQIGELGKTIHSLIKSMENGVKQIAIVGSTGNSKVPVKFSQQERIIRTNCMRARGIELNEISKEFRSEQKRFLHLLREREIKAGNAGGPAAGNNEVLDSLESGRDLTPEQERDLVLLEDRATDRQTKIIQLAKNINELAALFGQLNVLVIEQGTVLDRIDCNIETALEKVKTGTETLQETDEKYGKGYTTKCIGSLITAIIILFLILVVKSAS